MSGLIVVCDAYLVDIPGYLVGGEVCGVGGGSGER